MNAVGSRRSRANSITKIGSGMPIATSVSPILNGPSAPTRTSLANSSNAPIASACPVQAEMIGSGCSYMVHNSSAPSVTSDRMASSDEVITDRSKPAENRPSRPTMTTARASVAARARYSWNASMVVGPTTFALPSSCVMIAMLPSR